MMEIFVETSAQKLLDAVLALPDTDRAKLAQAVLESLGPDSPNDSDELEEWEAELDRRGQELRTDPSTALPWSDVKKLR
jgi:putative addiction module component (TIGR02574 family)